MATNNAVNTTLSGQTGTGNFVGSNSPTALTGYLQAPIGIKDSNGISVLTFPAPAIAGAVNWIFCLNNTAGNAPTFGVTGADTNITLNLQGKGTGGVAIQGMTANTNAASGYVGELFSAVVLSSAPVTITTSATNVDIASINLPTGDFDYWGNVGITNSANNLTATAAWINNASATEPDGSQISGFASPTAFQTFNAPVPSGRSISNAPITLYLSVDATFASGTTVAFGQIFARRRR